MEIRPIFRSLLLRQAAMANNTGDLARQACLDLHGSGLIDLQIQSSRRSEWSDFSHYPFLKTIHRR